MLNVPTSSAEANLQDRFNQDVAIALQDIIDKQAKAIVALEARLKAGGL